MLRFSYIFPPFFFCHKNQFFGSPFCLNHFRMANFCKALAQQLNSYQNARRQQSEFIQNSQQRQLQKLLSQFVCVSVCVCSCLFFLLLFVAAFISRLRFAVSKIQLWLLLRQPRRWRRRRRFAALEKRQIWIWIYARVSLVSSLPFPLFFSWLGTKLKLRQSSSFCCSCCCYLVTKIIYTWYSRKYRFQIAATTSMCVSVCVCMCIYYEHIDSGFETSNLCSFYSFDLFWELSSHGNNKQNGIEQF